MRDKGLGQIKGDTVTLRVQPNGGKLPVVIDDPEQVPDELCWMEGRINADLWRDILDAYSINGYLPEEGEVQFTRKPSKELIAERLASPCEFCVEGTVSETDWTGSVYDLPCPECGGSGKRSVPGAHLGTKGEHLRIL